MGNIMLTSTLLSNGVGAVVHQLNRDNFKQFIEDNDNTLVKFYAPWCGHCKKMAPDYEAASDMIETAKLAEVDVTVEAELGEEYGIRGFPTIKYFSKGQVIDYDGGRSKQDFVNYIELMSTDPVTVISSKSELSTFTDKNSNIFLYVGKNISNSNVMFNNIASANRLMGKFLAMEDETADEDYILVINQDGENKIGSITQMTEEDLTQKMKVEKLPLFGPVNGENFGAYMDTGMDLVWYAGDVAAYEKVKSEVEKVAMKYRGQFNFVHLDSEQFERQIEGMLGLSIDSLPTLVRTRDGPGRYIFSDDMTADNVAQWMENINNDTEQVLLKSEPVPENNDGPVTILVGENFDDIVTQDKDVVVMIHAPWCGHCKKLMPEFEKAAEVIREKSPETVMAIFDGTANEITDPNYSFQGFPTVYFKRAGEVNTMPFPFTERNANEILQFLSTNVKKPFQYEELTSYDEPVNVDDEL